MSGDADPVQRAMAMVPTATFLMTSAFEGKRAGMLVRSVQPCGQSPPLLCVACRKGHPIEPLIRDSHAFALCVIDPSDRLVLRKFDDALPPDVAGDPFDSMGAERLTTGAPVIRRAIAAMDCLVTRHVDIEADYELFIGQVVAARVHGPGTNGTISLARDAG